VGLLRKSTRGVGLVVWSGMDFGFAGSWVVVGGRLRPLAPCGRSYPAIATQRRMLKAIAANNTCALALTSPT